MKKTEVIASGIVVSLNRNGAAELERKDAIALQHGKAISDQWRAMD